MASDNISTYLRSSYRRRHNYTVRFFGRSLDVAVTNNSRTVKSWINRTLCMHSHRLNFHRGQNFVAGLGVQWCSFQSNTRPATIQISIGHRVLIFQIFQSSSIPAALSCLLSDSCITFVGYNIAYDCRLLRSSHDLVVSSSAELRSVSGMGNASMEQMVEEILGYPGVTKPWWIANSDWEAPHLSIDQVQYGALDAFVSFELGLKLVAGPALPNRESGFSEGFELDVVSDSGSGLRYSEADGSYSDSGRGFQYSSGPRYSEEYGSDFYSGDSCSMEDAW
ncbi:hypothetical protein LUZ61_014313 [Rhynchospora tenuis]|uniref:3'-5' exonuclease domain-containing protein n=1 Tax=Rhynchospora tenuis TaxID=198213 RepID=A0AAD5Z370_9POAL|nr:hypothetical protein LUZ61_014313 [Rhynchospora tenuis]